jgi:hypothetical protein
MYHSQTYMYYATLLLHPTRIVTVLSNNFNCRAKSGSHQNDIFDRWGGHCLLLELRSVEGGDPGLN